MRRILSLFLLALGTAPGTAGALPDGPVRLWPGAAPGALGTAEKDVPSLTPYWPDPGRATGAAVVVCPGGSYAALAPNVARDNARWLRELGIAAFVLKYRLGPDGYRHPAMLQDAARAVRLVRSRAAEWRLDPRRVGIMGSSAGGHLASTLLTHFDAGDPAAADPVERARSRPDLGILCYPVITMGGQAHAPSRLNLLGENPSPQLVRLLSNELQVTKETPPTFLFHTVADQKVSVENSLLFAAALARHGVPFSLHVYPEGAHGLGLGTPDWNPAARHPWTTECARWLNERGFARPLLAAGPPAAEDFFEELCASPAELWRGFDPEALPLEVEVVSAWEKDGVRYEKVFFTGEVVAGKKTRVFAVLGAPAHPSPLRTGGSRLPGILHCHGGGQTASPEWVEFWAKRGYVAVSLDCGGPWRDRKEHTDWGAATFGNMDRDLRNPLGLPPTPRRSLWYHWTVASRRALTLLARHPAVDPARLGTFGISMGGTTQWLIAGSDPRVKTAVPVYGCGYQADPRRVAWGLPPPTEEERLERRAVSPEAHAPYVNCPVLYLSATNDFWGTMDDAYQALAAVRAPVRQAFSPHFNHHVAPEQGLANLEAWMAWQLKDGPAFPASPDLALSLAPDGVPTARIAADRPDDVREVKVYYTLGDRRPQTRFWRLAETTRRGDRWEARLPVMDPWESVRSFANVTYRSGPSLSSNLAHALPGQIGRACATLSWSATLPEGGPEAANWYPLAAYADPHRAPARVTTGEEKDGRRHFTSAVEVAGGTRRCGLASYLVADPQFAGRAGWALAFDCRGQFLGPGLQVTLAAGDRTPAARTYTATVEAQRLGKDWTPVVLPPQAFRDPSGQQLTGWEGLERLSLEGSSAGNAPASFSRFRWIRPGGLPGD